jgi:hypothetical protein
MKKFGYVVIIVLVTAVAATFFVSNVQAAKGQLVTLTGFVDELIEQGIIKQEKEGKARKIVALLSEIDESKSDDIEVMNADKIEVTVSQLIENSHRTYEQSEDVTGLLLMVKNTTNEIIDLEAKRKCQVVYRIINDQDEVVYDKRDEEQCQTDEQVTYLLPANQTRMFKVEHEASAYELPAGEYTFEIEYPGYGGGEKDVTIL